MWLDLGDWHQYLKICQIAMKIFFYGKILYYETLKLESSCDIMADLYDPSNPDNYYAALNKFYEALMLGKPLILV